jgi:hypothetical protein
VCDVADRPALLEAAAVIASGSERAASRFGFSRATAIVEELRDA